MTHARIKNQLISTMGCLALALAVLAVANPVHAGTNPDIYLYDGTGCAGTNFHATHEYNSLGTIGWDGQIEGYDATTGSVPSYLARDDNFQGDHLNIATDGRDCSLFDNPLYFLGLNVTWANQASSLGEQ